MVRALDADAADDHAVLLFRICMWSSGGVGGLDTIASDRFRIANQDPATSRLIQFMVAVMKKSGWRLEHPSVAEHIYHFVVFAYGFPGSPCFVFCLVLLVLLPVQLRFCSYFLGVGGVTVVVCLVSCLLSFFPFFFLALLFCCFLSSSVDDLFSS